MKKPILVAGFFLTSILVFSQGYRKLKLGIGVGTTSANVISGKSTYIEPAFRIRNNYAIGLRLEGIFGTKGLTFIGSKSINGQYYFSNEAIRPFVGFGMGIYDFTKNGSLCDCEVNYEKNKIGFYPRLGIDAGHLTIQIEYNWMTPVKETTTSMIIPYPNISPTTVSYFNGNFFSTKIGLQIGGGKKK